MAENEYGSDQSLPPGAFVTDAAPEAVGSQQSAVGAEVSSADALGATTHDEDEGLLVISSPSGKGERQIRVSEWPRYAQSNREWVIKHTNYTGAHHSDNAF
ncbi:MAG: hypothetical protein LC793_07065 [Thermomicrobia bacterium]|nr:hypothetical protein [Thermomicrobia bacterium]